MTRSLFPFASRCVFVFGCWQFYANFCFTMCMAFADSGFGRPGGLSAHTALALGAGRYLLLSLAQAIGTYCKFFADARIY